MSAWRHLRAIVLLPGFAAIVVPAIIVLPDDFSVAWPLAILGPPLVAVGFLLWLRTAVLLARLGRGTLAPWDPTTRLVVRGPYRYVRNPMISGVMFVLLGEAAILGSTGVLIWFAVFFAVNAMYMPLVEEPGLVRRFGDEYERYRRHVPRWLPRLRPWDLV
jgi:protein-S-isoprenylcysteine O-methyltransferase Ste14